MWKSVLTTLAVFAVAFPSAAQNYPLPSKVGEPASLCKWSNPAQGERCAGTNAFGEPNEGKPTYQYRSPIADHVGRLVDSNTVAAFQHFGMRTVRAGKVRIAPGTRGSAPPRLYIGMGDAIGAYSLDTFFTTKIPSGILSPVNQVQGLNQWPKKRQPFENFSMFEGYFYPEANAANWKVPLADKTDRLSDFDSDDRGYVYGAFDMFGWGIVKDNGETTGSLMASVVQVIDGVTLVEPKVILSLKSGSKYYAVVSSESAIIRDIYDVTNPATPVRIDSTTNRSISINFWAKNESTRTLAVVNGDGKLRIYDYDTYLRAGAAKQEVSPQSSFGGMAFDDKGNLWLIEDPKGGSNVIHKLTPTSNGFNHSTLSPFPESVKAQAISAQAGYVAVIGQVKRNGLNIAELFLFKQQGDGLSLLDTDGFFQKFYHRAPQGYAQPAVYANLIRAVQLVKQGTKVYLMYHVHGLGDVYLLEGTGPSLSTAKKNVPFGTKNPNVPSGSQTGPFPGDTVTFESVLANSPGGAQSLTWNFGNPEAQSDNSRSGTSGAAITHQFTGMTTAAKILQPKVVTATLANDSSVSDSTTIALQVPEARIAIKATGELVTGSNFDVVFGDKFVDASDGSVEGHFGTWRIGNSVEKTRPGQEVSVGALGLQSVEFTASYGKYDPNTFSITSPFNVLVPARTYTVRPFVARLKQATRVGTTITYGATARYTTDTTILPAGQWTTKWTLLSPTGVEQAAKTDTVAIGTVPDFPFANALLINKSVVKLEITVAGATTPYTLTTEVAVPEPVVEFTNCGHVGEDCVLRAKSAAAGVSTDGWQLSWVVKRGATTVASGTGNPLTKFRLTQSGSYSVSVTETVFDKTVTQSFTVEETLCGPPPNVAQMSIDASCTACAVGAEVSFRAVPFGGYTWQPCDQIVWDFGDGTSATGISVKHTYSSARSATVKLTIKNPTNTTGTTFTKAIKIGGGEPPPPGCTTPTNIQITWTGPSCSNGGAACKAGDTVSFKALRGTSALQTCDSVTWNFGDNSSSNSKQPTHKFASANTYAVTATVSNEKGQATPKTVNVVIAPAAPGGGSCDAAPTAANVSMSYRGQQSGCTRTNGVACQAGESIAFEVRYFQYTAQACDRFEWNFDDGSAVGTTQTLNRVLAGTKSSYNVRVKVYTTAAPTGVTVTQAVSFSNVPAKQIPTLTFSTFPTKGAKGVPVTFTATSNIAATGWVWEFDGVANNSQASQSGTTSTITHTFNATGTRTVTVKARNAEDTENAPTGIRFNNIVIDETPQYRYLLPIVAHAAGQNNSSWRTDVQIYNPDTTVSASKPLVMTATLRDIVRTLEIPSSTYIYTDFMQRFTTANDMGPVIISTNATVAPQIWTRTYNQTEGGTFGQFIPAIRLDNIGTGGAEIGAGTYYLAGLRHDAQYRTNVGFVNPNGQTINATIRVYDEDRRPIAQLAKTLPSLQIVQFSAGEIPNLPQNRPFSLEIEVPAGQWVVSYASFIDGTSNDPVYIQAVRDNELASEDFRRTVVPGVGHVQQWRSDVSIFNPDTQSIAFDLVYYDGAGVKRGEAKNVVLDSHKFLLYRDLLKQGIFGSEVPDGAGILEVNTIDSPIPNTRFPLAFARTFYDQPGAGTYGQGIVGFARARANVKLGKPALIPGVRSDANYYTNIGVTNLSNADAIVKITLLNPQTGAVARQEEHLIRPNQSRINGFDFGGLTEGTIQIETNSGNVWAFASVIDKKTRDPEYVAATPRQ